MIQPVTETRRARLRILIAEVANGSQSEFARLIGRSHAQVGFWLTDPSKPHAKNLSHESARAIEAKFGKPAGWLDSPEVVA